jgi:hypothetical protein
LEHRAVNSGSGLDVLEDPFAASVSESVLLNRQVLVSSADTSIPYE